MDIEGIPLRAWSRETFKKIGKKLGETLDLEDNVDTSFGCKRLCVKNAHPVSILETFKIIVKERVFMVREKELFTWNLSFIDNKEKDYVSEEESDFVPNNKDPNHHINEKGVVHHEMLGTANGEADNNEGRDNSGSVNDLATIIGQQGDGNIIR
nr:RNA-directed DNA polymerase, eukaryota [Tanacetum cinerariifolium]